MRASDIENERSASPIVSICCVSYNQERFVARALDGMIAQVTDFPFEILIYDDASTDRTPEIIRSYQEKYPRLINAQLSTINQFSRGVKTLRALYESATGKYIALCEADDYWTDPEKLAKQIEWLEANPETVMVGHKVIAVDEREKRIRWFTSRNPFNPRPQEKDFDQYALRTLERVIPTCCRVFRNIPTKLPDEALPTRAGDAFLQVMLAEHGTYKYLETVSPSCYTVSESGIWSSLDRVSELRQKSLLYTQVGRYLKRVGHTQEYRKLKLKRYALSLESLVLRALKALGLLPLARIIKRRLTG